MAKQNVTLSFPVPLLHELKVSAAKRNSSMSGLMERAIRKWLQEDDDHDMRTRRMIERMKNSPGRGFGDTLPWDRNEMYERIR